MRFDIITIFPDFFRGVFDFGIVRRARAAGLVETAAHDLRAWAHGRHKVVDDRPFGGGDGMVLKPEPVFEAVELEEGAYYDWQLEGCRVETVGGRQLGTVSEVLHTGGEAPVLVVRDAGGRENLVPLAESICVGIDVGRKLIRVDAPEGLLEGE